jgi:hypothetical protein
VSASPDEYQLRLIAIQRGAAISFGLDAEEFVAACDSLRDDKSEASISEAAAAIRRYLDVAKDKAKR